MPEYEHWMDFCSLSVQSFIDQNRSEKVNSISTTRNSNVIEIDELPDDNVLNMPGSTDPQVIHECKQNIFKHFSEHIWGFPRVKIGPNVPERWNWNCQYILAEDLHDCAILWDGHQQQNFYGRYFAKTHDG